MREASVKAFSSFLLKILLKIRASRFEAILLTFELEACCLSLLLLVVFIEVNWLAKVSILSEIRKNATSDALSVDDLGCDRATLE